MYDKTKIIVGIIIFVALFTFPFLYNSGKATPAPVPELSDVAKAAGKCIESKEYMKSSHMELLNTWRTEVVRNGERVFHASDGKQYNMSLQNTCMECHANKTRFCDQCHNYADVNPYCWDCHLVPKERGLPSTSIGAKIQTLVEEKEYGR